MPDQIDTGLALSGGGYRAMLFNLGSVWRLNETGSLRHIDMITSVSGGSILNGLLALRWADLQWDQTGVASNFPQVIAAPIRALASRPLDVGAGIKGMLSIFSKASDKVTEAYDKHLFHGASLQQTAPFVRGKTPRFLFYATSLQTGSSVRIERKRLADYKIGEIVHPDLLLARVVAASSAFPPVLSPVEFYFEPSAWRPFPYANLGEKDDFKRRLLLTDGGVYDNMGLEAIWERCKTVLVSDGGAPLDFDASPSVDWTRQAIRVLDIVTEQTRALRRRKLIAAFRAANNDIDALAERRRKGAYWGIRTRIAEYQRKDALTSDSPLTMSLQHIRTRLNEFTNEEQGHLINWGYALADAAIRAWLNPIVKCPPTWPVPETPL